MRVPKPINIYIMQVVSRKTIGLPRVHTGANNGIPSFILQVCTVGTLPIPFKARKFSHSLLQFIHYFCNSSCMLRTRPQPALMLGHLLSPRQLVTYTRHSTCNWGFLHQAALVKLLMFDCLNTMQQYNMQALVVLFDFACIHLRAAVSNGCCVGTSVFSAAM